MATGLYLFIKILGEPDWINCLDPRVGGLQPTEQLPALCASFCSALASKQHKLLEKGLTPMIPEGEACNPKNNCRRVAPIQFSFCSAWASKLLNSLEKGLTALIPEGGLQPTEQLPARCANTIFFLFRLGKQAVKLFGKGINYVDPRVGACSQLNNCRRAALLFVPLWQVSY
jgi:hypothetical protein